MFTTITRQDLANEMKKILLIQKKIIIGLDEVASKFGYYFQLEFYGATVYHESLF